MCTYCVPDVYILCLSCYLFHMPDSPFQFPLLSVSCSTIQSDALISLTSTLLLNLATAMEAILLSDKVGQLVFGAPGGHPCAHLYPKNPRVNLAGIASFGLDLQKCEGMRAQ